MPADRSSTLTVLSALLLSIGGNLCQLYSGKPLLYSGTATELPSAGTIAEVLQRELSAYVSNTTCPSRSSSLEDSCPACVCAATTCPAPEPTRFWNTATAGAFASSLVPLGIALARCCQRLVTRRLAPRRRVRRGWRPKLSVEYKRQGHGRSHTVDSRRSVPEGRPTSARGVARSSSIARPRRSPRQRDPVVGG